MRGPAVILYDAAGVAMAVSDGVAIPAGTPGVLISGSDGGTARRLRSAADGTLRIDPTGTTTQPMSAASLPLPAGAATEATLATRASEATLASIKDTAGIKKITDALPAGTNTIGGVQIRGTGVDPVTVGLDAADGKYRLNIVGKVALSIAEPPPSAVKKTIAADSPLVVTGTHDTSYTITSGKTLYLQQIVAGAALDSKGSKVEVLFDNGTLHTIERVYVTGFTNFGSYPDTNTARDGVVLVGNGTNRIIIRRERLSGGSAQEVDAVVRGYEQ